MFDPEDVVKVFVLYPFDSWHPDIVPLLAFSYSQVHTSSFPDKPVNFFVVELNIFGLVLLVPLTGDHHQVVLLQCYELILDQPARRVIRFKDSIAADLDQTPEVNLALVWFKH